MSEQDAIQSSTKRSRSPQTSKQNGLQAPALQRPAHEDTEAWETYWKAQGEPWRTEPEIEPERQKYLAERRSITPDIWKGIYPFKDIKLNLHGLPLACLLGGLKANEWLQASQEQRRMAALHLESANLSFANLQGAYLASAYLERADLFSAHLERADFYEANLEGTYLRKAHLEGASLRGTFCNVATNLSDVHLGNEEFGFAFLSYTHWSEANLSLVNWAQIKELGDEYEAKQPNTWYGQVKNKQDWLRGYQRAVQANRQLATALQNQGLNEDAARFAYRAQNLQRAVFFLERKPASYLFSLFLDLLAGHGYKPWRSFVAYLMVIITFATGYYVIGHAVGPAMSPLGSFVFSMTSFHGRGFFPGGIGLDDPLTALAALEAFVGLLLEVTLIATLTQRLFRK
ncbi:MAG: hypothetical protein AUG54_05205 [Ktedonobacter sp. 13_1_20CM_4_53_7]|nr:MAG: hypothetical protein AUG54_05205 [Ktedonobacter sp. 13_1_20CM_4_53_7]